MTKLVLATLAFVLVTPEMSVGAAYARSPGAGTLHGYLLVAKQRALRDARRVSPAWQSRTGKTRQTTFIQDM
jgi:hypothetical protein